LQLINSPASSVRRAHSSNDSEDDFHLVHNKNKKQRKPKQSAHYHQSPNDTQAPRVNPDSSYTLNSDDVHPAQHNHREINVTEHRLSAQPISITN
jgi:hypothetical protein